MQRDTQTIQQVLRKAIELLRSREISEPRLSAELLFAHALGCKRIDLYLKFDKPVDERELEIYRSYIRRRLQHEPVQYIIGETEFYGLSLAVDRSVLIPRPETEILVEKVLEIVKKKTEDTQALDIGTGSGNIPIAIAYHCSTVRFTTIEASERAIAIARKNIERHRLQERIHCIHHDIFSEGAIEQQRYDLIVSNPPYITLDEMAELQPEVREYEPAFAATDGDNGLRFYERIAELHPALLKEDGIVVVEIGYGQCEEVKKIFTASGLTNIIVHKDYSRIDRVIIARKQRNEKN